MRIEEEIKQSRFSSAQQKAVINLFFTASWLRLRNAQHLKSWGITQEQFNVLRILRGQDGKAITVKEVTARMLDKSSNTSRIVDRLLKKELVTRTECPHDRRLVDLIISDKGQKLLAEIDEAGFMDQLAIGLTEEDALMLSSLLDKMRNVYPEI